MATATNFDCWAKIGAKSVAWQRLSTKQGTNPEDGIFANVGIDWGTKDVYLWRAISISLDAADS